MMYRIFVLLIVLLCIEQAKGQGLFKKLKNKAEQAAGNAAGRKIDNTINKSIDKATEKKDTTASKSNDEKKAETAGSGKDSIANGIKAYSKYDFVAGNQLLVADDFSQDEIGAFADKWNTNGKGEVIHLKDAGTKWLKMYQQSTYLTPNSQLLPESYTIEFDLILDMHNKGYIYPELVFSLFNSGDLPSSDNKVFPRIRSEKAAVITLHLGEFNNTYSVFRMYEKDREQLKTPLQSIKLVEEHYGKPMHIAISIHQQRFRLWVNETKIYDLPKVMDARFNQFAVGISSSNYTDEQLGFYFSNFKIAGGLPDSPSKLLTEGKLVTTAITFDINSATIKPSSAGAIKEIAEILQSNPDLMIRIIGHTDSDGDSQSNKQLSLRRADAIKGILISLYKIETSRIVTDGRGEDMPVSDNNSIAGKAQNRRVELVKL